MPRKNRTEVRRGAEYFLVNKGYQRLGGTLYANVADATNAAVAYSRKTGDEVGVARMAVAAIPGERPVNLEPYWE